MRITVAAAPAAAAAADASGHAATGGSSSSDGGVSDDKQVEGQSARAARVQARADQLHPTQLGSPSDPKGKRRRGSTPSQNGDVGHEARVSAKALP